MTLYMEKVNKEDVIWVVDALITLGAVDIHIVDNTHLEAGQWEISFVNYNMSDLSKPNKTREQIVWDELTKEIKNG